MSFPLPERLVTILDVAYHASFLRDEERPVTARILVLPPSELRLDTGPPSGLLPLRFDLPRRFDEHATSLWASLGQLFDAFLDVGADAGPIVND